MSQVQINNKLFYRKMIVLYLGIIYSLILASCNSSVPKEKLTIIDDILLGQSKGNLPKQLDSLSVQHKRFYTKYMTEETNDLFDENNFLNIYYTNSLNFSKYENKNFEHTTLLYPSELPGTSNINGMILILCHTESPWLLGDVNRFKNSFKGKYIDQNINVKLLEDIKNLYVSKYGKPKDTLTTKSHKYFQIDGNSIVVEGNPDVAGTEIRWETDYYDISFFTGLLDPYCIYNTKSGGYTHIFYEGDISLLKADPSNNEIETYSKCYIQYKLNDKAIKELNLDRKRI